jgi:hypothetical protein
MVKYCPECGKENSDSSEFCENCGEKLPQSTGTPTGFGSPTFSDEKSQVKKSSNTKIAIILAGLCCVGLFGVVLLSGFLFPDATNSSFSTSWDSTSLDETFSKEGLTFKYPSSWESTTVEYDGANTNAELGVFTSTENLVLAVNKEVPANSSGTIKQAKDISKKNLKQGNSVKILSDTSKTVNGRTIYEILYTFKDKDNEDAKALAVITGKDGKVAYYLLFVSDVTTFDENQGLIDNIIDTIKVK